MYMAQEEAVGLALGLSLGSGGGHHHHLLQPKELAEAAQPPCATATTEPSLTLSLTGAVKREVRSENEEEEEEEERRGLYHSAASSAADDDVEAGCNSRKKLRLTKEQSALLEDRFKEHCTLNPKQKAALARQLNLRPRQVEVWFQNRRARTKLKQTEVDCELLKRCCEKLTEENRRLHRELQHLRALHHHHAAAFFMPTTAAATLAVCPSCDRLAGAPPASAGVAADRPVAKRSFFATKSAAC